MATDAETEAVYIVVLDAADGVDALSGFSLRLSQNEAGKLAGADGVAAVVPDSPVHALGEQADPPSWGLDRIDQRDLPLDRRYRYPTTACPRARTVGRWWTCSRRG